MDDFFNHEYADEVFERVSKMDDDTAQMFTLMVAHDVLHRHIDDNKETISKRVDEVLGNIQETISKRMGDVPEIVELVAKNERKVASPEGAKHYNLPMGAVIRARTKPSNYKTKVSHKDGKSRLKVKYQGPADNFAPGANNFDVVGALGGASNRASAFEEQWNRGAQAGTNERTYNRISAGSKVVRDAGTAAGMPSVAAAGALGDFAGSFGPSAEKVVGPSMRRAAYRFRGTEKQPDPELMTSIRSEIQRRRADQELERPRMTGQRAAKLRERAEKEFQENPQGRSRDEITRQVFNEWNQNARPVRPPLPPETIMQASEMAAVEHLRTKLPSSNLAELQRQSGKIPPSEGVIIDSKGQVVAQAIGYQEDHFLPFNLKNLKGLQGGSYVRTRSSGGLTSEDLYTGLMSGARSMTVVSRSGVFTVDFADDLRGQRRFGDVARQMVNRYEKTLDAVKSKQIEREPMKPIERARIREEVEQRFAGYGSTPEGRMMIDQEVAAAVQEAKTSTDLSVSDYEEIERLVQTELSRGITPAGRAPTGERTGGPVPQERSEAFVRDAITEQFREQKQNRMLQLDGEGYETALKALQEQYPYFIANVSRTNIYRDTEGKHVRSRETDRGYVRPNYLRPKAVREGYFDPEIEGHTGSDGTGKYSAANTNYQNYANRPGSRGRPAEESPSTGSTGDSGTPDTPNTPETPQGGPQRPGGAPPQDLGRTLAAESSAEEVAAYLAEREAPEIIRMAGGEPVSSDEGKRNIRLAMRDPENRKKVLAVAEAALARLPEAEATKLRGYMGDARQSNEATSPRPTLGAEYTSSPRTPATFEDVPADREPEFYQTLARSLPLSETFVTEGFDDQELRDMSDASLDLAKLYERIRNEEPKTGDRDLAARLGYEARVAGQEGNAEGELFQSIHLRPDQVKMRAQYYRERSLSMEKFRAAYSEYKKHNPQASPPDMVRGSQ